MLRFASLLVSALLCAGSLCQEFHTASYEAMDYGPFLSLTLNQGVELSGRDNSTVKATIVRFGKYDRTACVAYDTELLRVCAAWDSGFIDFSGITFNGTHGAQPKARGIPRFSTRHTPGWAIDGNFTDPRPDKRGPMPKSWMKYKGHYRYGNDVLLSYDIADCSILELPRAQKSPERAGVEFARVFNLSPTRKALSLLVMELDYNAPQISQSGLSALGADSFNLSIPGEYLTTRIESQGAPPGSSWSMDKGRIVLNLPPLYKPEQFSIRISYAPFNEKYFSPEFAPRNLASLTHGGPPLWTEEVTTRGVLSQDAGPYVVDTLTAPDSNPWNSWLRFGGLDFFKDGRRAAVCTLNGDVWIVSGIDSTLERLSWKRFATGLHEPLGLKIVDEKIYVTGRNQITRLHDLNNDGEADFYENFNSDCIVSPNYHEFALDLDTDAEGNFYFAKSSAPGTGGMTYENQTPHNGCFFKLSKDGQKLEILARGLRAPNGVAVGPHGELTCSDNEGAWIPECPINEIKPGYFLGVVPSAYPDRPIPTKRDPPICYIPWLADNASGGEVWVKGNRWGPFENQMLHLSYGKACLFNVMTERVNGQIQGAVSKFNLSFATGIMRARFNPADGQLYVCGQKGWQTTGARDGALQRVRYTGGTVNMPLETHITCTGIDVKFSAPLNRNDAEDPSNYSAYWFNVKWTSDYGSPRFSPNNPHVRYEKRSYDPWGDYLPIQNVRLGSDCRTLHFEIRNLKPVDNYVLKMRIRAADGSMISQDIFGTINKIPR